MKISLTPIEGLLILEPQVFRDRRGQFFETYNEKTFADKNISIRWVQDNQSVSSFGVIRGLHYQIGEHAQTKLVRVVRGKILDVVVDLRPESKTYGKSFSIVLSFVNRKQLLIPKGFAHGFSALSKRAEVLYKCDSYYNSAAEAGIFYDDSDLKIDWKVPNSHVNVSEKDMALPSFEKRKI